MSCSTSAWLLSPLECSPQEQNVWTLHFCFWGWIMWKMYNKIIIEFGFRMISWIFIKTSCLCYLPQPWALADNTDLGFDNSWYNTQPHPIIGYYNHCLSSLHVMSWWWTITCPCWDLNWLLWYVDENQELVIIAFAKLLQYDFNIGRATYQSNNNINWHN